MSFDLKTCKKCGIAKPLEAFGKYRNSKEELLRKATCRECYKPSIKKYNKKNKSKLREKKRQRYLLKRDIILDKVKKYASEHKGEKKQYNKDYYYLNKKNMQIQSNLHRKEKRKNDPAYKLRADFSTIIRRALKNNGGSKKNTSMSKYLPYTIKELRHHLEQQFEIWMTWNNHGKYNKKTWDDNDPSTWTWQIDHIIPHSTFQYASMEDQAFKDCWALSNLRPLSAKQNISDGVNKIRHGDKNVV